MNIDNCGALYIVASPIGNLQDVTYRAVNILQTCDLILAEDTRRARILCARYGVTTSLRAFHEHNELKLLPHIIKLLLAGQAIALLSDAGTPLICDPGYQLLVAARANKIAVVPIPGPCAAIAALSVSGLSPAKFVFEGFMPVSPGVRDKVLLNLQREERTVICYETAKRLLRTLADIERVLGGERKVVVARELTKIYETIYRGTVAEVLATFTANSQELLGEMVLLIDGAIIARQDDELQHAKDLLQASLQFLPLKQAVKLVGMYTGMPKNLLYDLALSVQR